MLRCCLCEMVISVRGNEQHRCFVICVGNCCKIRCVVLCSVVLRCVVCCVLLCCVVLCFFVVLHVLCCSVALRCVVCCVVLSCMLCCSVVHCCVFFPHLLLILCRSKLCFIVSSTFWFVSVLWDQSLSRMYFLMCHS